MADRHAAKRGPIGSLTSYAASKIRTLVVGEPRFDVESEWRNIADSAGARFARGNISVQKGHFLMPDQMDAERKEAAEIARKWRNRRAKIAQF